MMPRPVGVFILAVLDFMGTIFLTVFSLILQFRMFRGFGFLLQTTILSPVGSLGILLLGPIQITLMRVFGWASLAIVPLATLVLSFVFAAIAGVAGYGMLKLKGWARIANIVFAILGIVAFLLRFFLPQLFFLPAFARNHPQSFVDLIFIGIRVGMNGLILWYLMRPQVRAAFAGGQSVAAQT